MTDRTNNRTVLGADCRMSGELTLYNDAVIMGEFQGVLRVRGMLEITETARVSGTVVAGSLRLAGVVDAEVVAETGIELLAGAMLSGHLYTPTLSIVAGAVLLGEVNVGPQAMDAVDGSLRLGESTNNPRLAAEPEKAVIPDEVPDVVPTEALIEDSLEPAAVTPIHTLPASLNTMLQRRRSRVISTAAKPS